MAQYDVYPMQGVDGFLLDVQSNLLDALPTRIVVPLYPAGPGVKPVRHLHPTLQINGRNYVMSTHELASIPESELTAPHANLMSQHDEISRAIYMLFQGF